MERQTDQPTDGRTNKPSYEDIIESIDHECLKFVQPLRRVGKADIIAVDVASTGRFILTVHSDVHLLLWDLKGKILATINTNQVAV